MNRFLAGLVAFALCFVVFGTAGAGEIGYKVQPLTVFTSKAASVNQAANDSGPQFGTANYIGGAANTSDTTYAFGPVFPIAGLPDTANFIHVGLKFATAIASGESVYTVVQGSADGGQTWVNCNVGAIAVGGSLTGQVASGVVKINAGLSSSTNVAAKSPVGPGAFYGQWYGFPYLRLIIISDKGAAMAANNTYQAWVTFPTLIR